MVRALRYWAPTSNHIARLDAEILQESAVHDRLSAINSGIVPPPPGPHASNPTSKPVGNLVPAQGAFAMHYPY